MGKINQHGRRADAIVKNMLEHSRQSTGESRLTDLNVLTAEYLKLAYNSVQAKDKVPYSIGMRTHFDESIGKINLVPQDIGRVLLNLYNNAFYAIREKMQSVEGGQESDPGGYKPEVSVSTEKTAALVIITVRDNGIGIPDQIKDKIFQPFFTTKPTGQGTGLGLSLAYDIVKAHGGEINVDSTINDGTAFMIQLPL